MTENNFMHYQTQLENKTRQLKQRFADLTSIEPEVFDSPDKHFRMRAEFRIWHSDGVLNYVMFKKGEKNTPIIIDDFPNASLTIANAMKPLLDAIQTDTILARKLFQIDFLSTTQDELLVTLLYHKKLDESWEKSAQKLQADLGISVIGRARKQKIVLNKDFVVEIMNVDGHTYQYQQVENSFTQPNAVICEKMLNWVVKHSKNNPHDLLELYCGNGNFTLPLSKNFRQVLATEVSKTSVKSANENIALNNIENVKIVRLSSEELTQALNKVREFRRLANINLDDYAFETVFVDPPRAGLDAETLAFVSQFDTIIYISCNPDTLHENIAQLKTHKIENFALFDQFPYTDHVECGVILKKHS